MTTRMSNAYPSTPREEIVDLLHGVPVPDPYRWLEEVDSPTTRAWIEAQNSYASEYLNEIEARDRIAGRLTELWNYEKYGVPFKRGDRYFFTCNDGLQNQSVLYWMEALDAAPKTLLDPNELSEDGTVALSAFEVTDDGRRLAYSLASAGSDWQEWRVRDVESGSEDQEVVEWSKFSGAAWTKDGAGYFYSRYDPPAEGQTFKGANYFHKLYYHRTGTAQAEDTLVYDRPDEKECGFGGYVSDDGRYLLITVWKGTFQENGIFYRDLEGDGHVVELLNSFDASYEFIGNDGPVFYFLTDHSAPLSRVIAIDTRKPDPAQWREIIPEATATLETVTLVGNRFIAIYLEDAYSRVRIFDLDGAFLREVDLPGIGTVVGFDGTRTDTETFYLFTSFLRPGTVYRYDLESGQSTLFRQPELLFDPEAYRTEQHFYTSKDGTRVPIFISAKRDLTLNGDNPTYLYGYGGYKIALTPAFSPANLLWMEMGGVYVQANLRGGGEYGKSWHEAGTKLRKQNVFDDFIAAAEWLIERRYTRTPRLAIAGGSNGGLLVGACMTQRPELFGACLPAVGVLDMLRFHLWTIGWAWVSDFGSPDDPEEFKALLAYSPCHNINAGTAYPATLITTGDHDDRVFPAHSFKFAAALQAAQAGDAPALIRIETDAGHGAGKPISKSIEEIADRYAFLVRALDMKVPSDFGKPAPKNEAR